MLRSLTVPAFAALALITASGFAVEASAADAKAPTHKVHMKKHHAKKDASATAAPAADATTSK